VFLQRYNICITVVDSKQKVESVQKMEVEVVTGCAEFPPGGTKTIFFA